MCCSVAAVLLAGGGKRCQAAPTPSCTTGQPCSAPRRLLRVQNEWCKDKDDLYSVLLEVVSGLRVLGVAAPEACGVHSGGVERATAALPCLPLSSRCPAAAACQPLLLKSRAPPAPTLSRVSRLAPAFLRFPTPQAKNSDPDFVAQPTPVNVDDYDGRLMLLPGAGRPAACRLGRRRRPQHAGQRRRRVAAAAAAAAAVPGSVLAAAALPRRQPEAGVLQQPAGPDGEDPGGGPGVRGERQRCRYMHADVPRCHARAAQPPSTARLDARRPCRHAHLQAFRKAVVDMCKRCGARRARRPQTGCFRLSAAPAADGTAQTAPPAAPCWCAAAAAGPPRASALPGLRVQPRCER